MLGRLVRGDDLLAGGLSPLASKTIRVKDSDRELIGPSEARAEERRGEAAINQERGATMGESA